MNIQNRAIIIGIREALMGQRLKVQTAAPKVNDFSPPPPKKAPSYAATLPVRTELQAWLAGWLIWHAKNPPK